MADYCTLAHEKMSVAKSVGSEIASEFGRTESDHRRVNSLNVRRRTQVKDAEVYALLAIAKGLDDVRAAIEDR